MPPKPAAKAAKGPAPPTEPDPAAQVLWCAHSVAVKSCTLSTQKHPTPVLLQLPPDIPAECPFQAEWHAAVCSVHVAEGVNALAIKEAFKQLKVLQQLSLPDLATRLEPTDPLAAEVAAAEAAHAAARAAAGTGPAEAARYGASCKQYPIMRICCLPLISTQRMARTGQGLTTCCCYPVARALLCSFPPALAAKLLQLRFKRDQGLAWKFELVKRREALAKAEAEAKVGRRSMAVARQKLLSSLKFTRTAAHVCAKASFQSKYI